MYEQRFSEQIVASVNGMARSLGTKDAGSDAKTLASTLLHLFRAMHDRLAITVALKPPAAKSVRKK